MDGGCVNLGEPEEEESIFRWLAGTVTINEDIVAPTGEIWDADAEQRHRP